MILSYAGKAGFVRPVNQGGSQSWDVTPGFKELARYLDLERRALLAIGTEQEPESPLTLDAYVTEHYGLPAGEEQAAPASEQPADASLNAADGNSDASTAAVEPADADAPQEDV